MSVSRIIANETVFFGESGKGYKNAIASAIRHGHIQCNASCEINIILRVREIIRQTCDAMGVTIMSGVLSSDHVHMFVEIPPSIAVSDFVQRVKGRSSHKIQRKFPELGKRYWGFRSVDGQ